MQAMQQHKEKVEETKVEASGKKAPGAFRTISEVADDLKVQQHVLRFWETKFTQIKPLKRGGGRRYYRPEDVVLLKKIHNLLYTEGYTIKGVQKLLRGAPKGQVASSADVVGEGAQPVAKQPAPVLTATRPSAIATKAPQLLPEQQGSLSGRQRAILESMLGELKDLRSMIKGAE